MTLHSYRKTVTDLRISASVKKMEKKKKKVAP